MTWNLLNRNRRFFICLFLLLLAILSPTNGGAMHISEGFLPASWCVFWYAAAVPFIWLSIRAIKKNVSQSPKTKFLLGIAGAYIFVLSALKLPSVTGSSSHLTGTGLGVLLFGLWPITSLCIIVLLFQALLLAHGGLTTLGANVFSMGIVGPLVAFLVYKFARKLRIPLSVSIFLSAMFGNLFTYIITSVQLALAFPENGFMINLFKFLSLFAFTQLPLAIIEGIITVFAFQFIQKYALGNSNQDDFLIIK